MCLWNIDSHCFNSGKSEGITIKNEKGRLSQEEIDRMVADAEKFAAEDEANRKKIEALNSLSSFVYGLKTQATDSEGLGGKLDSDDKQTILDAVKEATEWIEENGSSASVEDLEEKLAGKSHFLLMLFFQFADLPFRDTRRCQPHHD
jgi:heat shock protein 5